MGEGEEKDKQKNLMASARSRKLTLWWRRWPHWDNFASRLNSAPQAETFCISPRDWEKRRDRITPESPETGTCQSISNQIDFFSSFGSPLLNLSAGRRQYKSRKCNTLRKTRRRLAIMSYIAYKWSLVVTGCEFSNRIFDYGSGNPLGKKKHFSKSTFESGSSIIIL